MNTDKSSIEVKLFSGGAVINYEFRRTNKRLFGRNLEIKSFQLNEASSIDSAEKIEIFNTLKFEASKT
ncbi:MAG: hypothetical protein LBC18_05705, partial [Opitutaceae bacterium]|nr:hypothetical protein [Opitutaceae bacterium]